MYKSILSVLVLAALCAGCGGSKDKTAGQGPGGFAIPVIGIKVKAERMANSIAVVGSLAANEYVEIKSQVEGMVDGIHFEEGQEVKKDDVLITLDKAKEVAQNEEAQSNLEIAKTTFNRMESLVESGAVSKQEYDQAKSQLEIKKAQADLIQSQLDDMVIKAPFNGLISGRQVSLGQVIGKDKVLTVLIDDTPMKLDFHVPERYVSRLAKGQVIELKVAAYPDKVFTGEVYFIDPQVDPLSRTVLVKATVPNEHHELRSGMFARLDLITDQVEGALLVPESALVLKGDNVFVFVADKESKAALVPVQTGLRKSGLVQITSGLKSGDILITEGIQKIGPGLPVNVVDPNQKQDMPKAPQAK